MQEIADAGAKVLHNRCIQIGQRFNLDIVSKSTFINGSGTKVCKQIEKSEVKSIVKNDKLVLIKMSKTEQFSKEDVYNIYNELLKNNIIVENFKVKEEIEFRIKKSEQNLVEELLEIKYPNYNITQSEIIKLSVIGYGIIKDNIVLSKIIDILEKNEIEILDINLTQAKIEIITDNASDSIVQELHNSLIK